MNNPYEQPITPEMIEAIRNADPRDLTDLTPNRSRHLEILNAIFGTRFTEGGTGTGK